MTVGELRRRLEAYDDEQIVLLQGPNEELWPLHPCLGEAEEGNVVVIMSATHLASTGGES